MIPHLDGYHPPGCTCHPCAITRPLEARRRWAKAFISNGPRRGPNGTAPEPCKTGLDHVFRTCTAFTFCIRCNLPWHNYIGAA